jgi:[acyl-carrier-protein] S-malonyltransferase
MAAVLGGDPAEVLAAIEAAELYAANRNGPGQIVVAGSSEKVAKFAAQPPAGVRVVTLQVAGAFHTPYMAPAEEALGAIASGVPAGDPHKILLSNRDGTAVSSGVAMRQRLVAQVTAPVRWDLCMASLADLGVTALIELPPAGTLANLAKRALSGIEIHTLNTPADLPAARNLIARHGMAPSAEPTPQFRVVVAGVAGTFQPATDLAEGTGVRTGQTIGQVVTRQGPVDVTAHETGVLTEWLAHPDDPVAAGQPLARIGGHL